MVKLGLKKEKLESSKFEKRGVCEGNHEEDNDNGNNDSGNKKARVRKSKPNKKKGKMTCFLCEGSHILKKYPKKFVLFEKDKSEGKAKILGSTVKGVEAKETKVSEKKLMECFLCHVPHRLQKCSKKYIVKGDDGLYKAFFKLGSIMGRFEAKGVKRGKKK